MTLHTTVITQCVIRTENILKESSAVTRQQSAHDRLRSHTHTKVLFGLAIDIHLRVLGAVD